MDAERIKKFRSMTSDSYVQSMLDECLDDIGQLQAELERLKDLLRQVTVMYPQFSNIKQRRLMMNIEQALKARD